ncbi:MAG: [FeFe] hydrogenase H-cluster radical SAM maturase HydE [Candidatus Glassbacteria bacterium]|nr:[FeFe] hydrogenase H-cluster radical SAM maturase HydE [Candidatus Glassbacteria bacterium]
MERGEILSWLRQDDPRELERLWGLADSLRQENLGDEVHLRGLVEVSSHCGRNCLYCGLRRNNDGLERYRMGEEEILACASRAAELGYFTVVLQSGEDRALDTGKVSRVIRRIRQELPSMAITLSLGERSTEELALWRESGADRYLLRFETSRRDLYRMIHPPSGDDSTSDRFRILHQLRALGYETGSGVMVGIPGQSYSDLADDILAFGSLDLDMIGSGPYLPHPDTPLGRLYRAARAGVAGQVPNSLEMACKVIALTRVVCPQANIPATTALAALDRESGYRLGLQRGANVVMPNLTPPRYRALYQIYPGKAGLSGEEEQHAAVAGMIAGIGRRVGASRGDSPNYLKRTATAHKQGREMKCLQPQA